VLFRPKFSENVGSTARAMANMGCRELIVVSPQDFDEGRARALATAKGQDILDRMTVTDDLSAALAPFETVYGTTARTGGWRKGLLTPETAALRAAPLLREGSRAAILFGPEDKGLTNDETKICGRLVCIPTAVEASSLNLAQAVLIILYEFMKAVTGRTRAVQEGHGEGQAVTPGTAVLDGQGLSPGAAGTVHEPGEVATGEEPAAPEPGRAATHQEREALFANLGEALSAIDFLKDDNPDYWMLPVRAFVERIRLKRSEFNLLMGVCRQIKWVAGRSGKKKGQGG